jgi:uncharacterized repeat protein (TIGR03899 family)
MFESLTPEQIALIAASLGMPKLLIKLLDVIQQGTGTISEPYFIRKKAEALTDGKTYETRKLTEQFVESQKLLPSIEYKDGQLSIPSKPENDLTLQQRYENRFEYQQIRKQLNIENVTANAVEELSNDPEVENHTNDEPIDADWTARFFETIENVSEKQMQQLWGRVLAGEVKSPGSFSLRTLEILRNLKKDEAEIFRKIGRFATESAGKTFVADFNNLQYKSEENSYITFLEILALKEIGLLYGEPLTINYEKDSLDTPSSFIYANQVIRLFHLGKISLNVLVFTKAGEELLDLLPVEFDSNYLEFFCKPYYSSCDEIVYSKLLSKEGNMINLDDIEVKTLYKKAEENNSETIIKV